MELWRCGAFSILLRKSKIALLFWYFAEYAKLAMASDLGMTSLDLFMYASMRANKWLSEWLE